MMPTFQSNPHPDDLTLDAFRMDEADPVVRDHVASCATCGIRVKLLTRLAESFEPGAPAPEVPPEVERRILRAAHDRAVAVRRRVRRTRVVRWASAAAVAFVAFTWLARRPALERAAPGTTEPAVVALHDDLRDRNGDGRVDILDALELASAIESGAADATADLNGDGLLDRRDVDTIALAAVSLEGTLR